MSRWLPSNAPPCFLADSLEETVRRRRRRTRRSCFAVWPPCALAPCIRCRSSSPYAAGLLLAPLAAGTSCASLRLGRSLSRRGARLSSFSTSAPPPSPPQRSSAPFSPDALTSCASTWAACACVGRRNAPLGGSSPAWSHTLRSAVSSCRPRRGRRRRQPAAPLADSGAVLARVLRSGPLRALSQPPRDRRQLHH